MRMKTTAEERKRWRSQVWCHGDRNSPMREAWHGVDGDDLDRLLDDADALGKLLVAMHFEPDKKEVLRKVQAELRQYADQDFQDGYTVPAMQMYKWADMIGKVLGQ